MALFGIKRIQYCKATQLAFSGQNNPFLGIASEPTNTFTDIVCMINSRATLTIEQAVVNKQIVYTAKLQFVTPADPMLDVDHYAFIATTNEGERILLGANTRPQVAVVTAQGVFGTSGELTAYTTTAEFKADYRPLRLPVTAAEPISGPAYDICCGQIPLPQPADTRQFDICCGQIKTAEPISGPAYDVCCGEIVGTDNQLRVVWLDYNNNIVDTATYEEGEPEPTTSARPNYTPTPALTFSFNSWQYLRTVGNVKYYKAKYNPKGAGFNVLPDDRDSLAIIVNVGGSTTQKYNTQIAGGTSWAIVIFQPDLSYSFDDCYFKINDTYTSVDWSSFDSVASLIDTNINWIRDANNVRIGYYLDTWQGEI